MYNCTVIQIYCTAICICNVTESCFYKSLSDKIHIYTLSVYIQYIKFQNPKSKISNKNDSKEIKGQRGVTAREKWKIEGQRHYLPRSSFTSEARERKEEWKEMGDKSIVMEKEGWWVDGKQMTWNEKGIIHGQYHNLFIDIILD